MVAKQARPSDGDSEHEGTLPVPQRTITPSTAELPESVKMHNLLHEFRKLREEHGVILALLQKIVVNQQSESETEKALIEISQDLQPRSTMKKDTKECLWEHIAPGNDGLEAVFERMMAWLEIEPDPHFIYSNQPTRLTLPKIQLTTTPNDAEQGKTGTIYSPAMNLSDDTRSILKKEIRKHWPQVIPNILVDDEIAHMRNGLDGDERRFESETVSLYEFNPRQVKEPMLMPNSGRINISQPFGS